MHQHECKTKFKPYGKFLITYRTKFRLNARLSKINPRKMNKPIKFFIKCWNLNQGVTVLFVLKRFLWRVVLVILMFVAWLLDPLCFVAYHLRISCCLCAVTCQSYASSCRIELVAQRQHPASFVSSRSNLLWFVFILKNWRNICQVRPCKRVG